MINRIIIASLIVLLAGCSTLNEAWNDNKKQIISVIVKQLEEEKVDHKVIDKVIAKLEGIAAVDTPSKTP